MSMNNSKPKTAVLDDTDWRILAALQDDARLTNADLAEKVFLSPSPCLRRVRDLEQAGLIRRYVTLLDPLKIGLTVSVFIQVSLEKQMRGALDTFESAVLARDGNFLSPSPAGNVRTGNHIPDAKKMVTPLSAKPPRA